MEIHWRTGENDSPDLLREPCREHQRQPAALAKPDQLQRRTELDHNY